MYYSDIILIKYLRLIVIFSFYSNVAGAHNIVRNGDLNHNQLEPVQDLL